jgi:hypothetical protein
MAGTNLPQPNMNDFTAGQVTDPNQSEVQRQGFFDALLYPAAGSQILAFFSTPIGAGLTTAPGATAGTAKTPFDTNLQLPNQLPSGKAFQAQSIEIDFVPGSVSTANTFTMVNPSLFAAVAAQAVADQVADIFTFYNSGRLQFNILDKTYVDEVPLKNFPMQTGIGGDFALTSNSATTALTGLALARAIGRPYVWGIPMTLVPAQNFAVNLLWPGVVATPSGFNGRVIVRLDGYFARSTQ